MSDSPPRKSSKRTTLKIIFGSLAAFVSILTGEEACGGGVFSLFDACPLRLGYFLPLGLFELSVTLLAFSLLLSAFLDVYANLRRFTLAGRDIESVADMPVDD